MPQSPYADRTLSADLFKRLIDLGIALSVERDTARLLERIVLGAKDFAMADGGTLYLCTQDNMLRFEIIQNSTLNIAMGGTTGKNIPFPLLPLYFEGHPNHSNVATHVAITGQTSVIDDAYTAVGFDFSGTQRFDRTTGYRSKSFLTAPLKTNKGEVIGVIQLINAQDKSTGEVIAFPSALVPLIEALASLAAVALDNQRLISQQHALFDSFIAIMVSAIDAKSPHTGGHCQRVPLIAEMLAKAACAEQDGPFADFSLTEEQWYELKIASFLHDVGKVVTPVHIMDKATKLEKIIDRIELIKLRYEILKRDLEIERLETIVSGANPADLVQTYEARHKFLSDEFGFLTATNIGSECTSNLEIERVKRIAVTRKLVVNGACVPALEADEVENLSIQRGTLTESERSIVNSHVNQTIAMLEALPFPKSLGNVPEIAGGHHEKMDGSGYPKGLTRKQMSIPARMLAIADIFEALTSSNRPYKKPKSLSESIEIMKTMCDRNHIDQDLFDLFIRSGVHRRYAKDFLTSAQLDTPDDADKPGFS